MVKRAGEAVDVFAELVLQGPVEVQQLDAVARRTSTPHGRQGVDLCDALAKDALKGEVNLNLEARIGWVICQKSRGFLSVFSIGLVPLGASQLGNSPRHASAFLGFACRPSCSELVLLI